MNMIPKPQFIQLLKEAVLVKNLDEDSECFLPWINTHYEACMVAIRYVNELRLKRRKNSLWIRMKNAQWKYNQVIELLQKGYKMNKIRESVPFTISAKQIARYKDYYNKKVQNKQSTCYDLNLSTDVPTEEPADEDIEYASGMWFKLTKWHQKHPGMHTHYYDVYLKHINDPMKFIDEIVYYQQCLKRMKQKRR